MSRHEWPKQVSASRRLRLRVLLGLLLMLNVVGCDLRIGPDAAGTAQAVDERRVGNLVLHNVPEISAALSARLLPYQSVRSAHFVDWLPRGAGMLVSTRFAETAQLHMVAMPGGAREQQTFFTEPVTRARVRPLLGSPFGYVYARDDGGSENYQLYFVDWQTQRPRLLTDGRSRNLDAMWSNAGDRLAYTSTSRNGRDQDVLISRNTGPAQPVLRRGGNWRVLDWAPDDTRLLVARTVSVGERYLYVLELATAQLLPIWPTTTAPASLADAHFSPTGDGVYLVSDAGSEFERLHLVDIDSRSFRVLSDAIPWDIEALAISAVGGLYAFVANEDGVSRLYIRRSVRDASVPVPALPSGVISNIRFSPEGDHLAFTLATPNAPADAMALALQTGLVQRWTLSEAGGLDRSRFVAAERVRLPSFDAEQFSAFVYRAPTAKFAGHRPVVIDIHGGPEAQARPLFNGVRQFMVDELGITVIEPNVRGSTGYGKRFRDLDNGLHREDAVRDIGALLDWIRGQPGLDASRVAVIGGSYGGYMALASLARYGTRLRAGVDMVGISNFVSFLGSTAPYRRALRRAEYGDERDPVLRAFLEGASPLNQADKITQPLLIAQGANDPRVPRAESEQLLRSLQSRAVPAWYLLAMDEGHGFSRRQNLDTYDAAKLMFLERYLLGSAAQPSSSVQRR